MTAGYLSAHTPTRTLGKTPFEVWHGKKPDLSHLHEIGLHTFALILKHNPKIYECSFKCILVGYSPHSKAYRLYHPSMHCLIETFHIKFIERKDNVSNPLYPGHIIDIPVTDVSHDMDPSSFSSDSSVSSISSPPSSSSPKHTFVQDEEEPIAIDSGQVWSAPLLTLKYPLCFLITLLMSFLSLQMSLFLSLLFTSTLAFAAQHTLSFPAPRLLRT